MNRIATPHDTATVKDAVIGRETILEAARVTLVDVGVAALTVRAVAQAAGCSTTGIYTHFGGKQGVLDALYVEAFSDFHDALYSKPGDVGAIERAHRAARAYRNWALANPARYLLIFAFRATGYVPTPQMVLPTQATFETLVDMFGEAVAAGDLSGDPRAISTHLWATQHGYVMLELTGPGALTEDAEEAYFAGVSAALRAHGATNAVNPT
ncbi:TetR/AcrR family transcriptional regulator [Demequina aurantiaca]|uniref:TetR/AcrR family transcriptional regulator n=1 Tax=Demequina aurantiaca TaxID=676200 RepID=UPI003D357E79